MLREHSEFNTFESYHGIQAVIDRLNDLIREGGYVFRGYNKQDELYPSLIRNEDFGNLEDNLLKDFEKYGSNYFHATSPIDFMSYAQHVGLPTRLLDFTMNPFIALSFALYSPKSNTNYKNADDRYYYYIRYAKLEENLCVPSIPLKDAIYNSRFAREDSLANRACQCIDSVTDLFGQNSFNRSIMSLEGFSESLANLKIDNGKIRNRVILFIDPNQSNQRIIMQQGLFMFPYSLDKNEHLRILNNNSMCIMIHRDLRDELNLYLDTLGYNTFRLMPDLSSICQAVRRRNLDERKGKSSKNKRNSIDR